MATAARRGPDLSCPLCYEEYITPMVLPCKHRLCEDCVRHLRKADVIKCPDCKAAAKMCDVVMDTELREAMGTYRSMVNEVDELYKKAKNILCTVCKKQGFQWKCDVCSDKLCDECKANHDRQVEMRPGGAKHVTEKCLPMTFREAERLRERAKGYSEIMEASGAEQAKITLTVSDMEREKNSILEFLRRTQQQMIDMINSYFASLDEAYLDATPEEMDIINEKIASLRDDPRDPMRELKALQEYSIQLLNSSDELSMENFQKIKQMHLEKMENFQQFYGTPFKLQGRYGDETRRLSNLKRSKLVLEAIAQFDTSGRLQEANSVEECLPTVEEVARITGLSRDDVTDVIQMYDITLCDSDDDDDDDGGDSDDGANSEPVSTVATATDPKESGGQCPDKHKTDSHDTTSMATHDEMTLQGQGQTSEKSDVVLDGGLFGDESPREATSRRRLQTDLEHLNLGEIPDQ